MDREQALRAIKHHEFAAARYRERAVTAQTGEEAARFIEKAAGHEAAVARYREQFNIPTPVSFGQSSRNVEAVRAEAERIKTWKDSR